MSGELSAHVVHPLAAACMTLGQRFAGHIAPSILAAWLLLVGTAAVQAQVRGSAQIPPKYDAAGNLQRQGYSLDITEHWPHSSGYRPVRFKMRANPPLAEDATVTIRYQGCYYNSQPLLTVEQDFILPAGQHDPVAFEMSVPCHSNIFHCLAQVWVDGVPQPDLQTLVQIRLYHMWKELQMLDILPAQELSLSQVDLVNGAQLTRTFLRPAELSPRWIDYTAVDVLCIRRAQLRTLITQHPKAWRAIRLWGAAGGNLWIDAMGSDLQSWPEVIQLLGLPDDGLLEKSFSPRNTWQLARLVKPQEYTGRWGDPRHFPNLVGERDLPAIGDHLPVVTATTNPYVLEELEEPAPDIAPNDELYDVMYGSARKTPRELTRERQERERRYRLLTDQLQGIRQCSWGLGHVVLIADPWMDAVAAFQSNSLHADFTSVLRMPAWYCGALAWSNGEEFWEWVIPGVGRPPVVLFQVLISLFVIVIGPLNYFVLRHKRRLHLLVVTVPLSAALVTAGLVGYAALAEGFATSVRVRSFTYLDQTRGEAACWSRQTYYAGVAPAEGLRFPADVAVIRMPASESDHEYPLEMAWDPDQRLTRGWLRSRTMAQFLCLRSRATTATLQIENQDGAPPRVTNHLGTHVATLLLTDDAGKTYAAMNLAENAQAALDASQVGQAGRAIYDAISDNKPGETQSLAIAPHGGYLEWLIDQVEDGTATAAGSNWNMAPRTYVALVEASPEVVIGCEAQQVRSLHIIRGRW